MKKEYEKPFMEKIEFDYRNVIVASANLPTPANANCGENTTTSTIAIKCN